MSEQQPTTLHRGTVCHFGAFSTAQEYSRNQSVAAALESAGWRVVACRADEPHTAAERVGAFRRRRSAVRSAVRLVRHWVELARRHARLEDYDVLLVGYPAHADALLAARFARRRRRPLVVDCLLGLYDTVVRDRQLAGERSLTARLIRRWEHKVLSSADLILVDTEEQAASLVEDYDLEPSQVLAVPVGIDEEVWSPRPLPPPDDVFRVACWTTFIPLHGVEVVARAAKLLETLRPRIEIQLVGDGQTADSFARLVDELRPANLAWKRAFVPMSQLVELATSAHAVLGIFGSSGKAGRVVPYKVYQALALGRPVVTTDTPAARRVLSHRESALLIPSGEPDALAAMLLQLAQDRALCERLAAGGRRAYDEHLSRRVIAERLDEALRHLVARQRAAAP